MAQLVERQIDEHIPKSLREKIDRQQRELDSYHIQILNTCVPCICTHELNPKIVSEARRQNGVIQTWKHVREPVRHLLDENGIKSELFPETVSELLGLNGNPTSQCCAYHRLIQSHYRWAVTPTRQILWNEQSGQEVEVRKYQLVSAVLWGGVPVCARLSLLVISPSVNKARRRLLFCRISFYQILLDPLLSNALRVGSLSRSVHKSSCRSLSVTADPASVYSVLSDRTSRPAGTQVLNIDPSQILCNCTQHRL